MRYRKRGERESLAYCMSNVLAPWALAIGAASNSRLVAFTISFPTPTLLAPASLSMTFLFRCYFAIKCFRVVGQNRIDPSEHLLKIIHVIWASDAQALWTTNRTWLKTLTIQFQALWTFACALFLWYRRYFLLFPFGQVRRLDFLQRLSFGGFYLFFLVFFLFPLFQ